ncbi:HNH endonuclease signature motif containing protein [Catelliglobosispora koreensis]|uniref:HNH endonuclease signature motif containing protein n=1 Tax=Catelliglobosispora koreensis TaxID=129052 RepID=UPI001B7FC5B9|nr:HNH endonuclease signature motif containing protein [Catelliglobosispora koreensis]
MFLELLEGKHASAPAGVMQLEVTVETLAGLDDNPGKLSGYGPVAADIARQIVQTHHHSQWQFAVRASDGSLLLQGLTRARPPAQNPADRFANAALTRWIRLRDRTCRAPGCRMPAVRCQIDHTIRHADGGPTRHGNLAALCEYHHHAKDFGGWQLHQNTPGHFTWTSPRGRTYDVAPDPP